MDELKWTGERLVTDLDSVYGTFEHLHRYAVALELCKDKVVLDIASGEGYGTNLISGIARHVYGVDIYEEAILHAQKKYRRSNIEFIVGSATAIPLKDNSVDVVVSFETLEHLVEQNVFLAEIKRVLKPGGNMIMSTPDKKVYSERDPGNPYHLKELFTEDFVELIKNNFRNVRLYSQKLFVGSLITEHDRGNGEYVLYDGNFERVHQGLNEEVFFNKSFFNLIVADDTKGLQISIPDISLFSANKAYQIEQSRILQQAIDAQQHLSSIINSNTYKTYNYFVKKLLAYPIRILQKIRSIFY
jgi:2-polyprenyl-3-methyl-5-hydroxy-6-metoxy-1,4-benzoquinol methylase